MAVPLHYGLSGETNWDILSFGETPAEYGIEFVAATVRGGYVSKAAQNFIQLAKEIYSYGEQVS